MYAVVETGGKQYKVKEGDLIRVEKLAVEAGETAVLDRVIAVVDGEDIKLGKPYLAGAKVAAEVVEQGRHKKVIVYKFKSKKGYHKKKGHRQPFTALKIQSISLK